MGAAKNIKHEHRDAKRRVSTKVGGTADWGGVNAEVLRDAIQTVARQGGALRFGYSRDGGAYAIGVLGDGEPYTEYLRPTDDVEEYLRILIEQWL